MPIDPQSGLKELRDLLPQCLLSERVRLEARIRGLETHPPSREKVSALVDRWLQLARRSREIRERRAIHLPQVTHPASLPITARRDDIVSAIRSHQVVVIAGETGSGKTTQIPKMCLEAGLGVDGRIGCTQPRRVAALSIARRVAEELGVTMGREVGCKIRFTDQSSPETLVKFMTDGILLAETQGDRELLEYEAVIVDEAHERSLNIDFLLGHLKHLLARRPELKLVITSATINTQAFSEAFGNAPVIEVSGRMYPVEVRHAPVDEMSEETGDLTYIDAAAREVERVLIESDRGDVLIFMPTERDIRETRDLLQGRFANDVEVIPLFGRLSSGEQQRVFAPSARRKVVVATNIAETSLTIPGIRYVIDSGLARISRYNPRTRTRRLPIEPVSQSSANQRKGRSGRLENGVCIRLYSEEEFATRQLYTQPEIQRANLAEVILRMKAFHLGDIETFPFLNPPAAPAIASGYQLLQELGALDEERNLTALGRDLARLPIDPTIGRMILQSQREHAVREVLVIAAGLSIQDPRERPADQREAADRAHQRFVHPESDFLTLLNIWNAYHDELEALRTQNQVRRYCKAHFVSYVRMREWIDLHAQIEDSLKEIGSVHMNAKPAEYAAIHRSILAGLLGHVAQRKERNLYKAAGNREVAVFPGSSLFDRTAPRKSAQHSGKKAPAKPEGCTQPEWIMAGELVETNRLYARTIAKIELGWVLDLARHICKVTVVDPHWSRPSGRVLARERVFLHGLEIGDRRIAYGNVNPGEATAIFIRSALVEDDIDASHPFLEHNRRVRQKIESWQTRLRHHDLPDLDGMMFEFYARRIEGVSSVHELNRLMRERLPGEADFLCVNEEELTAGRSLALDSNAFPESVQIGAQVIPVHYAYAPGEEHDGVTLRLPVGMVPVLQPLHLQWVVPAFRQEQMEQLLRALPKALRVSLMPIAPKAAELAATAETLSDLAALSTAVRQRYGVEVPVSAWDLEALPAHLRVRFEIVGKGDKMLAQGRDLARLRDQLRQDESRAADAAERGAWTRVVEQWERYGLKSWSFGDVPERVEVTSVQGMPVWAYPGLQVEQGEVSLRLFRTQDEALSATAPGFIRLGELALAKELAWLQKDLKALDGIKELYVTLGSGEELRETAYTHLKEFLFQCHPLLPLRESVFAAAVEAARKHVPGLVVQFLDRLGPILRMRQELLLCRRPYPGMQQELDELLPKRFLEVLPYDRLQHLPRYLKAMKIRTERASLNPAKDREKAQQVIPFLEAWRQAAKTPDLPPARRRAWGDFRWQVEEFKVSLFAQELGTERPVSVKRLQDQLAQVRSAGGP